MKTDAHLSTENDIDTDSSRTALFAIIGRVGVVPLQPNGAKLEGMCRLETSENVLFQVSIMMKSWHENVFDCHGPLWGESAIYR